MYELKHGGVVTVILGATSDGVRVILGAVMYDGVPVTPEQSVVPPPHSWPLARRRASPLLNVGMDPAMDAPEMLAFAAAAHTDPAI